MDIRKIISKLPCNSDKKLRIFKDVKRLFWKYKYPREIYKCLCEEQGLFPQNFYYGHEYWLKKYSGFSDYIYGLIEHGICSKGDKSKVGWDVEWDSGSILTFGDARYETLKELYPEYNIVKIGPRIHYAPIDKNYYDELRSKIDTFGKTIVLFPSHSLASTVYKYDVELFVKRAITFAKDYNISNILVCLHPSDILHGFQYEYNKIDNRIIPVTGGSNQMLFLPRLKAILSVADITYSNLMGTHVGYSIYMKKTHIIDSTSDNSKENAEILEYNQQFTQLFADIFKCGDPWIISKEQYELVDYYFGLNYVKSPEDLYNELECCKNIYYKKFKLY